MQLRVISEVHDNMVIHIVEKIQWLGELLGILELSKYSSKDQQHYIGITALPYLTRVLGA